MYSVTGRGRAPVGAGRGQGIENTDRTTTSAT